MELLIENDGSIRCVYGEQIDLQRLGSTRIARASHVEPDRRGRWFADMSPVAGPRLGPFARRSEALAAEVAWLVDNWTVASD